MKKMSYALDKLDPDLARAARHMPAVDNRDVQQARMMVSRLPSFRPPVATEGLSIDELEIEGLGGALRLRIYAPPPTPTLLPALVFFHWGGFVVGDLETEHPRCVMLARDVGCVVISVDYRLAPEHPFPAAPDDGYAALLWAQRHAKDLGIDPERLAVGGTSAGATIAFAVAWMAKERQGPTVAFQLLGFPVTDDRMQTGSMLAFDDTPNWTRTANTHMWKNYLGETWGTETDPRAAPLRAEDLSDLPPTYIWTAEFDPLRDEGIALAQRLMADGVPVELHHFAGSFHGFDQVPDGSLAARSRHEQVQVLRAAFGTTPRSRVDAPRATLSHVMVHVSDVAATVRWYRRVFGLEARMVTPDGHYAELLTGETTLSFSSEALEEEKYGSFTPNRVEAMAAGFHLSIVVADANAVYGRALDAGAHSIHEPQPQPFGPVVARIRDCNGILVAIGQTG
ncbi:MAG: alpha/beta hydrolase fold domain-containing protein [Myxococcota bacterium]